MLLYAFAAKCCFILRVDEARKESPRQKKIEEARFALLEIGNVSCIAHQITLIYCLGLLFCCKARQIKFSCSQCMQAQEEEYIYCCCKIKCSSKQTLTIYFFWYYYSC